MLLISVAVAVLGSAPPSGGPLDSAAWTVRLGQPSAVERQCTDYSQLFWSVSLDNGAARATRLVSREHVDPLPFDYPRHRDREGDRRVARVDDGWLVGFNAGEFGGGLWWFDRGGRNGRRIRPSSSLPTNPADIFHAENVLGLPLVGGVRLVLMGLDHLTGRSGRVFRAVSGPHGWELAPVAVLDAQPDVWVVDGSKLLFLTESGLWSTDAVGAQRIHDVDFGGLAPTSLIRAADGPVYVGLRYYVLKLVEGRNGWEESWLVPGECQRVQLKDYQCECAP